jgi:hypothetical protein
MRRLTFLVVSPLFVGLVIGAPLAITGCGSSNTNEQEFLNSAPPGKPPENPNESFSERRSRTQAKTKKPTDKNSKAPADRQSKAASSKTS